MTIQQHEELLKKVKDLQEENIRLKKRKKYGLVWEDKPEIFDEQSKNALPVLIEKDGRFNDTISDPDGDFNILIEGDNYHSLSVLKYTHRNSVDLIYIDPPYNTGNNSWRYNNNYVEKDDAFRHSKWISFINKRLRIAKDLLKEEGVMVFTIDDYEIATVTLLLNEIFGEENWLNTVVVENNPRGRTSNAFFATSHEYYLFYGKNYKKSNIENLPLTREQKKAFNLKDEISEYRLLPLRKSGADSDRKDRPKQFYPIFVNEKTLEISLKSKKGYKEILPIDGTGRERAWKIGKDNCEKYILSGDVVAKVKRDGSITLSQKDRIKSGRKAKTIWVDSKFDASAHGSILINKILGQRKTFDYPKSIWAVIQTLQTTIASKKDALVLDFFAGSGTTGHAVLELNKEDDGNRKFILCTNNENKICEEVTYERIKRVSQGYKNKKGEDVEGLGGNLKYLKTDFIKIDNSIDDLKEKIVEASTQILCLKESTFKEKDIQEKIKIFENNHQYTAILFDTFYLKEFTEVLNKLTDKKVAVYVFAYDKNFSKEEFHNLSQAVEYTVEPIPEKLLETYQEIFNF